MRFVFPLDREVPYGQIMLETILSRGFIPEIVIEEASPDADHHRNLFLERLGGKELAPSIGSQVEAKGLRHAVVSDLNGSESERIIRRESPDLIVLGGTRRRITSNIFSIPPWGTLISHPGLLPHVRGASSPAWSILYDVQVGATVTIIDEGLDTGPVVKTRIVPVFEGDSYADVVKRNLFCCADLMAEVLEMFVRADGPIPGEPQDLSIGATYPTIPRELVEKVKAKLADGTYKWLEPRGANSERS
jgi:methionyl-tRNA formyltransferase